MTDRKQHQLHPSRSLQRYSKPGMDQSEEKQAHLCWHWCERLQSKKCWIIKPLQTIRSSKFCDCEFWKMVPGTSSDSLPLFQGLKMLRRLYLDENLLDTVPPDLPPTLQELKISENKLRGIDENSFQGTETPLHPTMNRITKHKN